MTEADDYQHHRNKYCDNYLEHKDRRGNWENDKGSWYDDKNSWYDKGYNDQDFGRGEHGRR